MSKLLALEWDSREARLVVGSRRGEGVLIEHAISVELSSANAESMPDQSTLGARLVETLATLGVSRPDTIVALGRASIELRTFNVPPVPDDELPDVVRLQSPRHFTTIDDDWALDFVELASVASESRSVLAAAVAPTTIANVRSTCEAAKLPIDCLVLRPFAAASLLGRRASPGAASIPLLVDILADEADLTVLAEDRVVFTRTTRLPGEAGSDERAAALTGEVRRTVLAARNLLDGHRVESIVLCGEDDDHQEIERAFAEQIKLPVERFDPFSACRLSRSLQKRLPEHRGRFAPLLGLLQDEASGVRHAIDFLNPRQRPAPPDRRRLIGLAIAAMASLALFLGYFLWSNSADIDHRLLTLQAKAKRLKRQLNAANASQKDLAELTEWQSGDIMWLDELARVSRKAPPPAAAIVTQLTAGARRSGGGQLIIDGLAVDESTVLSLERALRDERHEIHGSGYQEDVKREKYRYGFRERIEIQPPAAKAVSTEKATSSTGSRRPTP